MVYTSQPIGTTTFYGRLGKATSVVYFGDHKQQPLKSLDNPDLDLPTPDDIFPDDDVGLDELRWRSAPWAENNWEDTENVSDDTHTDDEPEDDDDTPSQASDISATSAEENLMSGTPL